MLENYNIYGFMGSILSFLIGSVFLSMGFYQWLANHDIGLLMAYSIIALIFVLFGSVLLLIKFMITLEESRKS